MEEKEARKLAQRYQKLKKKKTLLLQLDEIIPWSDFRPLLNRCDCHVQNAGATATL